MHVCGCMFKLAATVHWIPQLVQIHKGSYRNSLSIFYYLAFVGILFLLFLIQSYFQSEGLKLRLGLGKMMIPYAEYHFYYYYKVGKSWLW